MCLCVWRRVSSIVFVNQSYMWCEDVVLEEQLRYGSGRATFDLLLRRSCGDNPRLSIMPSQVDITAGRGNPSPDSSWNDTSTLNINASDCLTNALRPGFVICQQQPHNENTGGPPTYNDPGRLMGPQRYEDMRWALHQINNVLRMDIWGCHISWFGSSPWKLQRVN